MYYLLEDNRIIEWNGDCIIKDTPKKINGVYKMKKCIIFKSKTIKDGFVKKQSENVYDLIEMGDVYLYQNKYMIIPELSLINDDVLLKIFKARAEKPENIKCIYKPDAQGNYIKVWEVKENE